jgi:hypothetical protein
MKREDLLPGVTVTDFPPVAVYDARRAIRRARRKAVIYDAAQLLLLAGVDWLFFRWPSAHVPMLDRHDSLLVVGAMNILMAAYIWLARAFPRWSARRVASTWSPSERARFATRPR